MIEILLLLNGAVVDRAEAETPEGARCAARILHAEASSGAGSMAATMLRLSFFVDGRLVRGPLRIQEVLS